MYAQTLCIKMQKPSPSVCLTKNPKQHICLFFSKYKNISVYYIFCQSTAYLLYEPSSFIHLAKWKINKLLNFFLNSIAPFCYFLVVCVVRVVVKVMFDSHEQPGEPPAATYLRGEDDTWDEVVCGGVRRWDSPQ